MAKKYAKLKQQVEQMNSETYQGNIEVVKPTQEPWAFTVKMTGAGANPTKEDYESVLARFNVYGFVKCHAFEDDSTGRLHIHGIVLLRPGFWRKNLCFDGYHTKLELVYNEQGWLRYISKDRKELKDMNAKDYKSFYLFGPEPAVI